MSSSEAEHRIPLLEKFLPLQPLLPSFSRTWTIIIAMAIQVFLCSLVWAFGGALIVKEIIPLSDKWAYWVYNNPSEVNLLFTGASTILGMSVSFLLGITVQQALTFRLSRGIRLSMMTAWIQLATKSLVRCRWRWILLSLLWLSVINSLTTAWSNLLTPGTLVRQITGTGRELDFLNPAVSNFIYSAAGLPAITPTARNYSLTPDLAVEVASLLSSASQAGSTAADFSGSGVPTYIGPFNFSTGGVLYSSTSQPQFLTFRLNENYQGLSANYTFVQQGFTADISCATMSSPGIILNNTDSVERITETPSGPVGFILQTWSWSTNCSGNGNYYTGVVNIMMNPDLTPVGNGLFATSVCFYQGFSGPSNQSFLMVMQSPSSLYSDSSFNLPTVCQVTPIVTTMEVQYNVGGTANITNILERALLPNDAYGMILMQGFEIWLLYFLAQGPYSNSLADDAIKAMWMSGISSFGDGMTQVLEQYVKGIFEDIASNNRISLNQILTIPGVSLPTIPLNGTMSVQTIGWKFNPKTHIVALTIITLVTVVTVASGIFALMEANRKTARILLQGGNSVAFDPTNLVDVLVASSTRNQSLANALSKCKGREDCEKLMVELAVSDEGQSVLMAVDSTDVTDEVEPSLRAQGACDSSTLSGLSITKMSLV